MEFTVIIILLLVWIMCIPANIQRNKEENRRYQESKDREIAANQLVDKWKKEALNKEVGQYLRDSVIQEEVGVSINTMKRRDSKGIRSRWNTTIDRSVKKVSPKTSKEWFIEPWVAQLSISPAEQLIINELNKYPVQWYREVSFKGFVSPKNAHYRYDFWLPSYNTIIEYHGKIYHMDDEKMATDKIKEEFCRVNGINLVVYRSKDYYHMEQRIKQLISTLS